MRLIGTSISGASRGIADRKNEGDDDDRQKGKEYPLDGQTYILFGAYKNDLKTRLFMKKLVGEHFHFTAFGQDWMKKKWYDGKPPTYAEFAAYWSAEYLKRKQGMTQPKDEWAYIKFIKEYIRKNPNATKEEILQKWFVIRKKHLLTAQAILEKVIVKG